MSYRKNKYKEARSAKGVELQVRNSAKMGRQTKKEKFSRMSVVPYMIV